MLQHNLIRFSVQVIYRVVPGLTFEICQSGTLTPEVGRTLFLTRGVGMGREVSISKL